MKIDLVVVSGRTLDTQPSFMIQSESSLYLFNVPDQTRRVFAQYKLKASKVRYIFITSKNSESIGGVFDFSLGTYGRGFPDFKLVSSPGEVDWVNNIYLTSFSSAKTFQVLDSLDDESMRARSFRLTKTVAFDIEIKPNPGHFLPKKALEKGVTPGPMFKKLNEGLPVTLSDGTVVTPVEVHGPPTPGAKVLVIDVKSERDLTFLPDLNQYSLIVHFTDPSIIKQQWYLQFFRGCVNNLCFMESGTVAFIDSFKFTSQFGESLTVGQDSEAPDEFVNGLIGTSYILSPPEKQAFCQLVRPERFEVNLPPPLPNITSFGVTFTGTNAMIASRIRNVPGILIHLRNGYIVLDCGEGFFGQLQRKFGKEGTSEILRKIELVWISHAHSDHSNGLQALLQERARVTSRKIPVFAPHAVQDMKRFEPLYVDYLTNSSKIISIPGAELRPIPVCHTIGSLGCEITIEKKWKVAYSGDHHPYDSFGNAVKGPIDLLIHEATIPDCMEDEIDDFMHSTIRGALTVGAQVKAKFIALTHMGQRHKSLNAEQPNVFFAYDYMTFTYENIEDCCAKSRSVFSQIRFDE